MSDFADLKAMRAMRIFDHPYLNCLTAAHGVVAVSVFFCVDRG